MRKTMFLIAHMQLCKLVTGFNQLQRLENSTKMDLEHFQFT